MRSASNRQIGAIRGAHEEVSLKAKIPNGRQHTVENNRADDPILCSLVSTGDPAVTKSEQADRGPGFDRTVLLKQLSNEIPAYFDKPRE